jgi:hypothetical protein
VVVSALASDSQTLYVGTTDQGMMALALGSNTASLLAISGTGAAGLPSTVVNGVRVIDGRLYVATGAGVSTPGAAVTTGSGDGGGGGCSMSTAGEPDPMLWLLVGIAALQIAYARRRRVLRGASSRVEPQATSEDRP